MNTENTQEEILNISWHLQKMVLKALNTSPNTFVAAEKLGITERTVYRYKKDFSIKKNRETRKYIIAN